MASVAIPDGLEGTALFNHLIDYMRSIFDTKNHDYAGGDEKREEDPWLNFRGATDLGIPPFISAWVRKQDKVQRGKNVFIHSNRVKDESLIDTFVDDAVYSLILACTYVEFKNLYGQEGVDRLRDLLRQMIALLESRQLRTLKAVVDDPVSDGSPKA